MPAVMGIDIETFSSAPLPKCGVYRYADASDFEILLFSYSTACDMTGAGIVSAWEDHAVEF